MTIPSKRVVIATVVSAVVVAAIACRNEAARSVEGRALQTLPSNGRVTEEADFSGKGVTGGVAAAPLAFIAMSRKDSRSATQVPPTAIQTQPADPSMIIRNGEVSVQVDSLERAIEAVRGLASSLGGYLGNVSIHTGEKEIRSATLEVKVPAARFDDAMGGMRPLGKVERSAVMSADVGEEYVDVSARIANAKRLEARLVTLLATRTGKLEDVLAVERELARVREEIERMEGRIRYLKTRVATSTIMATVHEKPPIVAAQPGTNPIAHAFVNMWRNFVLFIATSIELLGVAFPLGAIGWLGFLGWRRWRKRRELAPA